MPKRWSHPAFAFFLLLIVWLCLEGVTHAQTTEYFDVSAFKDAAGSGLTVVGFDDLAPVNGPAALDAYRGLGLDIRNRDGFGINVVQNTLQPYGNNYVTEGQINSPPNVISSGFRTADAVGSASDNIDVQFTSSMRAAGLWIGSLGGGGCENFSTTVEFTDAAGAVIAAETLNRLHAGVVFGLPDYSWDNRVFYGIVSSTPITQIRVTNHGDGCDVISLDDVQFAPVPRFRIQVETGAYTGFYSVIPSTFAGRGDTTLSLEPGKYFFDNWSQSRFSFEVRGDGTVAAISNADAAFASDGTLFLNTATITVDPLRYQGHYFLLGHDITVGRAEFHLIPGLSVAFDNGSGSRFFFDVRAGGVLGNVSNTDAATASPTTLFLNTVPIVVDPGAYTGTYFLLGHAENRTAQTFELIRGLSVYVDNYSGSRFSFEVTAGGTVGRISNGTAATANNNMLAFNNTAIAVDPQAYAGAYSLLGHPATIGRGNFVVIPGLQVYFDNGFLDRFRFHVDATGSIVKVENSVAAIASGNVLRLNNVCLSIDPGTYAGLYWVHLPQGHTGLANITVVPGTNYYIGVGQPFTRFYAHPEGVSQSLSVTGGYTFLIQRGSCDSTPPITSVSSDVNLTQWHARDVTLSFSISDEGGAGARGVMLSAAGAATISEYLANGTSTTLTIAAEGITVVTFAAVDNAGNAEASRTVEVRIDRTAPRVSCNPAPASWSAQNISVSCTIEDTHSGAQVAAVTLMTDVVQDEETSSAATNSESVCDRAGNCAMAGPVTGLRVDRRPPAITITAPAGQYTIDQVAAASYACNDAGSGVTACSAVVPAGAPLSLTTVGAHTFTVTAADMAGNSNQQTVTYIVSFATISLHDNTRAVKSGATIPIKIQLTDASGVNKSSAERLVRAIELVQVGGDVNAPLQDPGESNPDGDFRFTDGMYVFNLKTTGLAAGRWRIGFTAAGDPRTHYTYFQVR